MGNYAQYLAQGPLVTSFLLDYGPTVAPMVAASAAWTEREVALRALHAQLELSKLTIGGIWFGINFNAWEISFSAYTSWVDETAFKARLMSNYYLEAVAAWDAAVVMVPLFPVVLANRIMFHILQVLEVATLGLLSIIIVPAMIALQLQYEAMRVQAAAGMQVYDVTINALTLALPIFTPAPSIVSDLRSSLDVEGEFAMEAGASAIASAAAAAAAAARAVHAPEVPALITHTVTRSTSTSDELNAPLISGAGGSMTNVRPSNAVQANNAVASTPETPLMVFPTKPKHPVLTIPNVPDEPYVFAGPSLKTNYTMGAHNRSGISQRLSELAKIHGHSVGIDDGDMEMIVEEEEEAQASATQADAQGWQMSAPGITELHDDTVPDLAEYDVYDPYAAHLSDIISPQQWEKIYSILTHQYDATEGDGSEITITEENAKDFSSLFFPQEEDNGMAGDGSDKGRNGEEGDI